MIIQCRGSQFVKNKCSLQPDDERSNPLVRAESHDLSHGSHLPFVHAQFGGLFILQEPPGSPSAALPLVPF